MQVPPTPALAAAGLTAMVIIAYSAGVFHKLVQSYEYPPHVDRDSYRDKARFTIDNRVHKLRVSALLLGAVVLGSLCSMLLVSGAIYIFG